MVPGPDRKAEERHTSKAEGRDSMREDGGPRPATSAWRGVAGGLAELGEYANWLLAAKKDAVKLRARKVAILVGLGLLGAFAFGTLLAAALVILLLGLSRGVGEALDRAWLGQVIIGAGIPLMAAAGIALALAWLRRAAFKKTVARYEGRERRQEAAFGGEDSNGRHRR